MACASCRSIPGSRVDGCRLLNPKLCTLNWAVDLTLAAGVPTHGHARLTHSGKKSCGGSRKLRHRVTLPWRFMIVYYGCRTRSELSRFTVTGNCNLSGNFTHLTLLATISRSTAMIQVLRTFFAPSFATPRSRGKFSETCMATLGNTQSLPKKARA